MTANEPTRYPINDVCEAADRIIRSTPAWLLGEAIVETVRRYAHEANFPFDEIEAVATQVSCAINLAWSDPGVGMFDMSTAAATPPPELPNVSVQSLTISGRIGVEDGR